MKILTVTELSTAIKAVLEPPFQNLSVKGEISNFKPASSGHLYFTLKDPNAQISVVLFKGNASKLPRMPKDGDQVVLEGDITLYAPRGQYQMIARDLKFFGVGELLLRLHQLKEELQALGWFRKERKRTLPKLPRRIGVVTSPTGAVIQDILHVLTRRFAGFEILLNPVKVQGEGAAQEIAQAIFDFNRYRLADVLIVGRGGGSIEDLWSFNERIVAEAIYRSEIPIISAVGHETDFTIADLVADVRAPTPSAAAEIAMAEKQTLLSFLEGAKKLSYQRILQQIAQYKKHLTALQKHPLLSSPYAVLSLPIQKIDEFSRQLELLHPKAKIERYREKLLRIEQHFRSLHPQNLLKKGYAILFSENDNSIILSAAELKKEERISALLSDGKANLTVNQVTPYVSGHSLF